MGDNSGSLTLIWVFHISTTTWYAFLYIVSTLKKALMGHAGEYCSLETLVGLCVCWWDSYLCLLRNSFEIPKIILMVVMVWYCSIWSFKSLQSDKEVSLVTILSWTSLLLEASGFSVRSEVWIFLLAVCERAEGKSGESLCQSQLRSGFLLIISPERSALESINIWLDSILS